MPAARTALTRDVSQENREDHRWYVRSAGAGRSVHEMIEEADANLLVVIKDMRDAAKAADESNDPGTVDLFSRFVQIHEKHEWFLREILKKKDGLVA